VIANAINSPLAMRYECSLYTVYISPKFVNFNAGTSLIYGF
jgi:hypothetical protein